MINTLEYTTLKDITEEIEIYYDPDPSETVVPEDKELVKNFNYTGEKTGIEDSPWVLRLTFDKKLMIEKGLSQDTIFDRISDVHNFSCVYSDDSEKNLVFRIRDQWEVVSKLEKALMGDFWIKGIPKVHKVDFQRLGNDWKIETEGSNLPTVLALEGVDHTRTSSNDIHETFHTLGIEAARELLVRELRSVHSSYGIYVNYRHISLLCEFMTKEGFLTSITRD